MSEAVHLSDFEADKENIQPIQEGRDPTLLVESLAQAAAPDAERQKAVDEKIRSFEEKVSSASGTGTLTDWLEYVEYLKQVFPKETFRERVFDVLERGVRAFVGDKRYENDVSYVKMWLHYADLVTDPLEVFRFMEARGIGATTAVFYEERGRFYEENGMLAEAEEAYLTGIRAKATPFSQLQDAYRRCRARRAHAAAEHEPSATPSPATAQPKRLVLGTLKGKVGTFRDSTLGAGLADLSPAPARAANFAKYTVAADTPPPVKGAAQGFPTFTPLATPQRARRDELRTPLHERVLRDNAWVLPPEREGSKENVLQATQWTAFREPLTVRKPGKASIFVDPELDTRPRTEVKRPRPSARASCAAGAQGASVRRPDERLCFATELVMRDGAEYRSFEECRAEKYLAHMRDGGVVRETCGGRESADDLLAVLGGLVSPTSTTPPAPASTSTPTPADTSADTSVDAILASLGLGGLCTKRGREPADDATPSPKHGAEDADVAALLASVGGSAV